MQTTITTPCGYTFKIPFYFKYFISLDRTEANGTTFKQDEVREDDFMAILNEWEETVTAEAKFRSICSGKSVLKIYSVQIDIDTKKETKKVIKKMVIDMTENN